MPLDSIFLAKVARELNGKLAKARVDKIHQPSRTEITFALRGQSGNMRLLVSASQNNPRVHITNEKFENPASAPMFCMLLRKHLGNAKIVSVSSQPFERVCKITFEAMGELGDITQKVLIVELLGRASNVILTSETGHIIAAMSYIDISEERGRELIAGVKYKLPAKQEKYNFDSEYNIIKDIVLSSKEDVLADKFLLSTVLGISPLLSREAVYLATGGVDKRMSELDPLERINILKALTEILSETTDKPVILLNSAKEPIDFTFTDILQYGSTREQIEKASYSELLDDFYMTKDRIVRLKAKAAEITKFVQNTLIRTEKRINNQKIELDNFKDREKYRIYGELITANLHSINKGDSYCKVQNYYTEDLEEVKIPLDVTKSPSANANMYFKRYQKAKSGEKILQEQISSGQEELVYLESVSHAVCEISDERDISDIKEELTIAGYLKKNDKQKKKDVDESRILTLDIDGYCVYVGKNNRQNDYIITKIGRATDYWLHTLGIPGSHVLIKSGDDEVPDSTLTKVAKLAAYYSKARGNKNVPVTYTRLKNVKKPNGAKLGYVIFTASKTAFVEGEIDFM